MAPEGYVVLVHAFPLNAHLWSAQAGALPPGWRLHAPDLPGFGDSTEPVVDSIDRMAGAVLASMDAAGIRSAVIGGLSMGGYVTLAMYRQAPERFKGMILADTRCTPDNEQQREGRRKMRAMVHDHGASAIADEMMPKLLGPTTHAHRPELAGVVRSMIEKNSPAAIAAALEAMMRRPDSTPLLGRITVPALIVCGEEDVLTPPADSEVLHRGIGGSRYSRLAGAGHLSNIEAPDAFSDALHGFLASIDPSHPR